MQPKSWLEAATEEIANKIKLVYELKSKEPSGDISYDEITGIIAKHHARAETVQLPDRKVSLIDRIKALFRRRDSIQRFIDDCEVGVKNGEGWPPVERFKGQPPARPQRPDAE